MLTTVKDFYQTLYQSQKKPRITSMSTRQHKLVNQSSEELPSITLDEIEASIKELKNNHSPGNDGILAEALKKGNESLL